MINELERYYSPVVKPETIKIMLNRNLVDKAVEKFEVSALRNHLTPLPENVRFDKNSVLLDDEMKYKSIIGSLLYLSSHTRPDVAYAVNILSTKAVNPRKKTFRLAKRVLKFVKQTQE